jgi:hypothetical protein
MLRRIAPRSSTFIHCVRVAAALAALHATAALAGSWLWTTPQPHANLYYKSFVTCGGQAGSASTAYQVQAVGSDSVVYSSFNGTSDTNSYWSGNIPQPTVNNQPVPWDTTKNDYTLQVMVNNQPVTSIPVKFVTWPSP